MTKVVVVSLALVLGGACKSKKATGTEAAGSGSATAGSGSAAAAGSGSAAGSSAAVCSLEVALASDHVEWTGSATGAQTTRGGRPDFSALRPLADGWCKATVHPDAKVSYETLVQCMDALLSIGITTIGLDVGGSALSWFAAGVTLDQLPQMPKIVITSKGVMIEGRPILTMTDGAQPALATAFTELQAARPGHGMVLQSDAALGFGTVSAVLAAAQVAGYDVIMFSAPQD